MVEKDGAKDYLVENAEYASKARREIPIETDDIGAMYKKISFKRPEWLHGDLSKVSTRPWSTREWTALDKTTECMVFREW
ncbi:MAG: hypothetical protein MK538_07330 [Planctomycetes bacterium]|nr:hypothetical protein [Planctomycetota bacterium]